jgi:sec-independent protein translocase protein TatA
MGSFSIWHWAIVILIVVLLFGRGKISDLMGDVAKGIKSFKRGMAEDDTAEEERKALPAEMSDTSKEAAKDKVAS